MSETLAPSAPLDVEGAVGARYGAAAQAREAALCCPVEYDRSLLEAIPPEIVERDYGCGDPSKYVRAGETVLDLGAGAGKICYILAQVVGPEGRVIGVDVNPEMLALARRYQGEVARRIGHDVVEFRKGRIQDLRTDLDRVDAEIRARPIRSADDWLALEAWARDLAARKPMIPDGSVDVVVSNCVLNLVRDEDKETLVREIHRVLRRGGRVAISDIVADEPVPEHLKRDPELWSGCVSGAFVEGDFLRAFERAGFYGISLAERAPEPFAVVEGIEFRSVTVVAYKGKEGVCLERNQAAVYLGPWKEVVDDDGHRLRRGERAAVCDKTYRIYGREPYAGQVLLIDPHEEIPLEDAAEFDCRRTAPRHPRETKGQGYAETRAPAESCCGPEETSSCC